MVFQEFKLKSAYMFIYIYKYRGNKLRGKKFHLY